MRIITNSDTVTVTDEQLITDALTADVEESKKTDKSIEQRAPQPEKYTIFKEVQALQLLHNMTKAVYSMTKLQNLSLSNNASRRSRTSTR